MNCLHITLFFNTVASIVQTFIKSWNQLLYPPNHVNLLPALWTTSWLLLVPQHRRRTFSQLDVSTRRLILMPYNTIHHTAIFLKMNPRKSDVWLTVHRNSVWNKKPTRCHFVLSFISPLQVAQHVSGNHVPIFRSWRLHSVVLCRGWRKAVRTG